MDRRCMVVTVMGGASVPFLPSDIANLALWLKADAGTYQDAGATTPATADTHPVRLWQDQSGSNNHASAASDTVRPLLKLNIQNNLPSLRYDGVDDLLNTTSFLGAGYSKALSYFAVVTTATDIAGIKVYLGNAAGNWYTGRDAYIYASNHALLDVTARKLRISPTSGWKKEIEGMTYDGTTWRVWQRGNYIEDAKTADLGLSGALTVGAYSTGAFMFTWDIHEILVYNRGLSVTEATQVQQYLATKWGMPLCTRRLYFECDSLSFGVGSTAGNDYPNQLWRLLGSNAGDHVWNFALSSSTINDAVNRSTSFSYDNGRIIGINSIVCFLAGTNDINGGESGADTYTEYVSYCQARQAQGYKVVAFTMLPFGIVASHETERTAFSALVRANWATFADALADIAADTRIGDAGDQNDTTYYAADKVHLNDAGYAIVAGIAKTAIDTIT